MKSASALAETIGGFHPPYGAAKEENMAYADVLELNRRQPRRVLLDALRAPQDEGGILQQQTPMTGAASFLAYLGAAPLIAAALVMIADPLNGAAAQAFLVLYGAALLIFFGGVRWGVAVMKPKGPRTRALVGAGLPMLAALPLFAPGDAQAKMIVIMALTLILLVDDLKATRRGDGAPAWYLGVRAPLTVLIEVAFLVALAAGMRG